MCRGLSSGNEIIFRIGRAEERIFDGDLYYDMLSVLANVELRYPLKDLNSAFNYFIEILQSYFEKDLDGILLFTCSDSELVLRNRKGQNRSLTNSQYRFVFFKRILERGSLRLENAGVKVQFRDIEIDGIMTHNGIIFHKSNSISENKIKFPFKEE